MQQIDEMCPAALENILGGGPGYDRENAFYIETREHTDMGMLIRLVLKCHVNHLFEGAEGETWNVCGSPNVEIKAGTMLFRLTVYSLVNDKARVIWYEIPFNLYLSQGTLINYLEKTFEDIL